MTFRLMQAAALMMVAACGSAPSSTAAQTRNEQTSNQRPFTVTEVARFTTPWAMDFLPRSGVRLTAAALVTEKDGRLWLINTSTGARQQVSGVPRVKVAGQGGLGDVVAHPDFAGNQRVYLSYAEAGPSGTSGAAVGYGRLILGGGQPRIEGFKVIWRQSPKVTGNGHFGHRIAFAPDGSMFVSSGEREKMAPAQDLRSSLGKILRLTAEGAPAPGNPFNDPRADSTRDPAIWSYGHRNALGIAFAADGRLWSSEMGPQGGDEFNLILPGRNYGWPSASYGSHYGGGGIPDQHRSRGFEEPKLWWSRSISPGSLLIYTGNLFPQWKGDALIGALSGESLIRVDIEGDRASKADRWPMGERIRAVDQGPRGEVYLLEDGGRLLRLEPAGQTRR
ncbi:PQQ-dependent sugar dehydrogenase [Sphingomonas sp.]|uniref:PQQ-dependent sugar dehydrogenase n=1 Tax=Sphingomonas sp. TaxID=28214 RepID=UPI001820B6B9|nr:PQQ-dependent sugar dehydrogenase [Sphingomonas sp.]MBA3512644.1 PQQ-dependent sugar dehydrogenase [Sphingomonas sp.]